jgi:tocopherol O-methyltransferase
VTTSFGKDLTGALLKEKVSKFYDIGSPLYMKMYGEHIHDGYYITGKEPKEKAQENLIKLLVDKGKIKRGARILDVGCGVGGSSVWLAGNLGAATTGITISPVQLKIARKLASEKKANSQFLLMDAEHLDFNETFDVIWAVAVMTHFRDQENFIKSATKLLDKNGKFIIFDWMLHEDAVGRPDAPYLKLVTEGMLLASLYPMSEYLKWFMQYGYRVIYAEDITGHTMKTWDVALSVTRGPAALKLLYKLTREETKGAMLFLKSLRAMKMAMKKGILTTSVVIAEKL